MSKFSVLILIFFFISCSEKNVDSLYIWYSIDEKGNRSNIEFFKSEKDAVQFLFEYLINNER